MTFLFAKKSEKLRERRVSLAGGKLYRSRDGLRIHSVKITQTGLSVSPAEK